MRDSDSKFWLWIAVFLLSATIAQLVFHVRTGSIPSSALPMPVWFAVAMSIAMGVTAYRSSGLLRVAIGIIALGLLLEAIGPLIGLSGWPAWSLRSTFTVVGSSLLIMAVRPTARVKPVTVAAAMMLLVVALYSMQRLGYNMWLRANKQNSVMSP
jgi:hypothetical protein